MSLKNRTGIFSRYSDKPILISSIFLIVFSSFMIMSAAMPSATGQTSVIVSTGIRQAIYAAVSIFVFYFVSSINVQQIRREVYWLGYGFILFLLLLARRRNLPRSSSSLSARNYWEPIREKPAIWRI